MKIKDLQKIALRQNAIYIPNENTEFSEIKGNTLRFVDTLHKYGFSLSQPLLNAINKTSNAFRDEIKSHFEEVLGIKLNWAPLVKNWEIPTNESIYDHWITAWCNEYIKDFPDIGTWNYYFENVYDNEAYAPAKLKCGHIIPEGTFPLHRYNGCPFCGTPFVFDELKLENQGSKQKILELWQDKEMINYLESLLTSKMPLDATQNDSLKLLLKYFTIENEMVIGMKETLILVVDELISQGKEAQAGKYFRSPQDIMRYLWYKKTGFLQIVEPKTIINKIGKDNNHISNLLDLSIFAKIVSKENLKLKYTRKEAKMVAHWLNDLPLSAEKIAEQMHPKRQMWVRFIRALRLAEYSKKTDFERLRELLDIFYNQVYEVWQGRVNHFRLKSDAKQTFALLQERPSLFARSLFANMLWFGAEQTLEAFGKVSSQVPMRLIFTLNSYAENYFDRGVNRSVKTLIGTRKSIPANKYLDLYSDEKLEEFKTLINDFTLEEMKKRFAQSEGKEEKIYIDPKLYEIPMPIGDRSQNLQDFEPTLMGEKFALEGNKIRLFMQWGKDLPAQHLDMDLSCNIIYPDIFDCCSYYNLSTLGCKHSGDIRSIPHQKGTAEYIDIEVDLLKKAGAKYVVFTCNAYSVGSITPNLVVGWMDSKYPMKVSEKSGVAYDPSCVMQQVRVSQSLQKGLAFGVLDVEKGEIIWLELPFQGQISSQLSFENVEALLKKLSTKITIGKVLEIRAKAQQSELVEMPNSADVVYDVAWARKMDNLTSLLVD